METGGQTPRAELPGRDVRGLEDRTTLTDPRHYNIRWLELLHEVHPRIERFGSVL